MDENKIQETEKIFDSITQVWWPSILWKWPGVKSQISTLKSEYSIMAREVVLFNSKLDSMTLEVDKLNHQIELKDKDISNLNDNYKKVEIEKETLKNTNQLLSEENKKLNSKVSSRDTADEKDQETLKKLEVEKETLKNRNQDLQNKNTDLERELTSKKKELESKEKEYEKKSQTAEETRERFDAKILDLEEKEKLAIEEKHKEMELTWTNHEDRVKARMKEVCERLSITYVEKSDYEYNGKPDNSVLIANEYIIFDAKSPGKIESLGNFPTYLKDEAEKAKKYAKNEKVKKDIYFVVSENTLDSLITPYFEEGNYRVHVISINSLETILRSLKKLDDYENLKDLDPEEREAMFNFMGRLLHATKRRIQVDAFYGIHVDSIIKEAISNLSDDNITQIEHYEKASKWNPGRDEKKKRITLESTDKSVKDLQKVAFGQEINTNPKVIEVLESIPLRQEKDD